MFLFESFENSVPALLIKKPNLTLHSRQGYGVAVKLCRGLKNRIYRIRDGPSSTQRCDHLPFPVAFAFQWTRWNCHYISRAAKTATRQQEFLSCLSVSRVSLMKHRQILKRNRATAVNRVSYIGSCKLLRWMIEDDICKKRCQLVKKDIQSHHTLKKVRHGTSIGRKQLGATLVGGSWWWQLLNDFPT